MIAVDHHSPVPGQLHILDWPLALLGATAVHVLLLYGLVGFLREPSLDLPPTIEVEVVALAPDLEPERPSEKTPPPPHAKAKTSPTKPLTPAQTKAVAVKKEPVPAKPKPVPPTASKPVAKPNDQTESAPAIKRSAAKTASDTRTETNAPAPAKPKVKPPEPSKPVAKLQVRPASPAKTRARPETKLKPPSPSEPLV